MKDFEGLPLFAKVVELSSFARAARHLQVPTTTVSRKIQQLENQLGGKLLNRTTRSLSLTELGERVLPRAVLIKDTLEELSNEAEEFSAEPIGTLRIDAPRAFCHGVLSPLLSQFHQQYPGINLHLDCDNRMQDLTKSSVDFAFRIGELRDSSLVAMPLSKVHNLLVASPQWLKSNKAPMHPNQLADCSTIRNQVDGYILPWQFSMDGESVVLQSQPQLLSNDMQISVNFALNSAGIALLPVSLIKQHLKSGELVGLLPHWQTPASQCHLLYPDRKYLPQKSRLFIEFIRENKTYFEELL